MFASQQETGTNVIEFRQNTAGWTWGVTGLLLENFQVDLTLIPGVQDPGAYGHNYGTNQNPTSVIVAFEGTGSPLQLSVTGYDIDAPDEVSVYLNGSLQGHLRTGPDNGLNAGDVFVIFASQQVIGTNVIEFRQSTAGWTWGVTDLLLEDVQVDLTLTLGVQDPGAYGNNYGTNQNPTSVMAAFEGTGSDLQLSVTGYDIDAPDEVSVYLNGSLQGHLRTGPDNGLNAGDVFVMFASQQETGTNVIEFRQNTAGWTWGVTDLRLSTN
jgi:hypothetical protein